MAGKTPKTSLLAEAPANLPSSPPKEKKSREERFASFLVRLANRLPSPHKETLLQIAEGVKVGKIALLQRTREYVVGNTIHTPFGEGKILDVLKKEGVKRIYLKVKLPSGEVAYIQK